VKPAARKTWEVGKVFHSYRIGIAAKALNLGVFRALLG
jgi:hypothetical protein